MGALIREGTGLKDSLLGNEAVVRGALEAGVGFVAGYPGTPSSEITDAFAQLAGHRGLHFEYSINEKIAVEMAFAASLAGVRSLCAMKHLGLMVAGDPISTIPYIGVRGGMVIVSAGDPSCRTSPNEQDQRHLGPMLHIPVLDPSTPAEARELTRFAFELSEVSHLPVLLRITTRVCHARAEVELGEMLEPKVAHFVRDPQALVPVPHHARRMRLELPGRLEAARRLAVERGLVRKVGEGSSLVLMSGSPSATTSDLLDVLDPDRTVARLRLPMVHPLPEPELLAALEGVERVLVVEELSPFLEDALAALVGRSRLRVEIMGKRSGHLPEAFEYEPEIVQSALHECFGFAPPRPRLVSTDVPGRPPSLCPGCPHRATYIAAKSAFGDDQLYFNDIGCYTLGFGPPLDTVDALLCMGAGFTLAAGVGKVTGTRSVGFMGDGTFFHAGMPALLDAIKEGSDLVAVILDNRVTAMTGFQEVTPGGSERKASIADIARSLGATHVETVDPFDLDATIAAFGRARDATGVSVIVAERECPVYGARRPSEAHASQDRVFSIDHERCRVCGRGEEGLRCSQDTTIGFERSLLRAQKARVSLDDMPRQNAPCSVECPLSLCIQGYAGHIAAGEHEEALGHILERTALPESVCRVCHRPCETACISDGKSVSINALKRFVVGWSAEHGDALEPPERAALRSERIAVVGAGPSGLAAAAELWRRGYEVSVLDAAERAGGMLASALPTYRLPADALERDIDRVLGLGIELEAQTVLGKDVTIDELFERGFAAIYLAIGGGPAARLEIPRSDGAPPLIDALSFLTRERAGRSESLPPKVVVIGGGNAAVDAARSALRAGALSVEIACIEPRRGMPALEDEVEEAGREGISIHDRVRPLRVEAEGIVFRSLRDGGDELTLPCDLVIAAIGQRPDVSAFERGAPPLSRHEDGRLVVDAERCLTSHPRIFAGGDMVAKDRTVTAAMASGLRAAWSIDRELAGPEIADQRPPPRPVRRSLPVHGVTARPRDPAPLFDEEEARADAARCAACGRCGNCRLCIDLLGCPAITWTEGRVGIDAGLCNGCGVCADLCPNGAIVAEARP